MALVASVVTKMNVMTVADVTAHAKLNAWNVQEQGFWDALYVHRFPIFAQNATGVG